MSLTTSTTLEEFNNFLRGYKDLTIKDFKTLKENPIINLRGTTINYLVDLNIISCSTCTLNINPTLEYILKHLKVSS